MSQRPTTRMWMLLVALGLASVGPVAAGHYVEQTVSSSQNGMNLEVRAWADGEYGKVEFTKSDSSFMPAGSYLLTRDGGQTVYLIDPAERTYSVWDMDALFATLGEVMKGAEGVVNLDFKDVQAEDLGSEPGDELLGYDTTRKSWRTGYTMDMKVVFMEKSHRLETTTEAWITNEIDNATLRIWFAVKPPTTGDPDLDLILTQNMSRIDGTPLKVVQQSTMTEGKTRKKKQGGGRSTRTTMEVTAFREESVEAGLFDMPEGYDEVPLIDFSGQSAAESKQREDGPLKALGGLFGGKRKNEKKKKAN